MMKRMVNATLAMSESLLLRCLLYLIIDDCARSHLLVADSGLSHLNSAWVGRRRPGGPYFQPPAVLYGPLAGSLSDLSC
jgi:hypothetical protein